MRRKSRSSGGSAALQRLPFPPFSSLITASLVNEVGDVEEGEPAHESRPEDEIAESLIVTDERHPAQQNQWHLRHLRAKEVPPDLATDNGHYDLVQECAQQERDEHGCALAEPPACDARSIDVLQEERVHGLVPLARKDVHARRVPPVLVELPIGKARKLGKAVADAFEHDVEDEEVVDHHWQSQLQHRLDDGRVWLRRVRDDKVLGDDVNDEEGAKGGEGLLEEVERSDPVT